MTWLRRTWVLLRLWARPRTLAIWRAWRAASDLPVLAPNEDNTTGIAELRALRAKVDRALRRCARRDPAQVALSKMSNELDSWLHRWDDPLEEWLPAYRFDTYRTLVQRFRDWEVELAETMRWTSRST